MQQRWSIDVGGISVAAEAETIEYRKCVAARLGEAATIGPTEVEVAVGRLPPKPPVDADSQRLEGCEARETDDRIWLAKGGAAALIEGAHVSLGGPVDTLVEIDHLDDLLQFAIAVAVATPQRLMIHGAITGRDGLAVAIVGGSGQGKSTLAAAALLGEWDLLGDDLAIVHPASREVRGVQRPPMVPAEIASAQGLRGEPEQGPRGRVRLAVEMLNAMPHELIGVLAVEHGSEGSVVTTTGADLRILDEALAVPPFRGAMRRQLAAAATLVSLPTVVVAHARDPLVRISRAQELLEEAFVHCLRSRGDQ